MNDKAPDQLTRKQAEAFITRRLKISKWFARAMFAVGLGCGFALADSPEDPSLADRSPFLLLTAVSVAAPLERIRAKKAAEKTVMNFAAANGAADTGQWVTRIKIEDGRLEEAIQYDYRTMSKAGEMGTALTGLAILAGGTGLMVLRQPLPAEPVQGPQPNLDVAAAAMISLSALVVLSDGKDVKNQTKTYIQRLDNIEGGLVFDT